MPMDEHDGGIVQPGDNSGAADKAERSSPGPRPVERVWDFVCGNPACPKPKVKDDGVSPVKQKTKPVGAVPAKNCDGCDEWNWQKLPGERTRPVPEKAKPKAAGAGK